jgi:hypothetical protein
VDEEYFGAGLHLDLLGRHLLGAAVIAVEFVLLIEEFFEVESAHAVAQTCVFFDVQTQVVHLLTPRCMRLTAQAHEIVLKLPAKHILHKRGLT